MPASSSIAHAGNCFAALALAAALAGCASRDPAYASSGPATAEPMSSLAADWLDGDTSVTPARLERLMVLGRRDAAVAKLLDEARDRLGHGSMGELYALFSVCSSDVPHENAGRTTERHDVQFIAPDLESVVSGKLSADAQKQIDAAKSGREVLRADIEQKPDYLVVKRWLVPTICLTAHESVATAYDALAHELTHALRRDPFAPEADPVTAPSLDAFLGPYVLSPGDEVDAYIAGGGARVRLEHTTANLLPAMRGAFDLTGRPIAPREAFVPMVLEAPPRGAGYRDGALADALVRSLKDELKIDQAKSGVLAQVIDGRQKEQAVYAKNADILQYNVGIQKKNVDIANQNGDPASANRFRAEVAKAESDRAHTVAMATAASASIARLSADLAAVNARIAAIQDRLSRR